MTMDQGPRTKDYRVSSEEYRALLVRRRNAQLGETAPKIVDGLKTAPGKDVHYENVLRPADVVVVPDVHGALELLTETLERARIVDQTGHWCGGKRRLVQLGDVIDRGEASLACIELLAQLKAEALLAGGSVSVLAGNHEAMAAQVAWHQDFQDTCAWLYYGGWETMLEAQAKGLVSLDSKFELEPPVMERLEKALADMRDGIPTSIRSTDQKHMAQAVAALFHPEHGRYRGFIGDLKLVERLEDTIFVHGGISPQFAQELATYGVAALNHRFQRGLWGQEQTFFTYLQEASQVREGSLGAESVGPLWFDFNEDLEALISQSPSYFVRLGETLRGMGINNVVVGHTVQELGQRATHWRRFGIRFYGIDTAMYVSEASAFIIKENGTVTNLEGLDYYRCLEDEVARGEPLVRRDGDLYESLVL
jgi:hypothetical protein